MCKFLLLFAPCSTNNSTVVVFQKCGKWLIWFQFLSSTSRKWLKIIEGYHYCALSPKSLKSALFSCVFPFFQPKHNDLQDGFVKGSSCATSLLRSPFDFAKARAEKKQLDAVFLDYSKAFDSVSFNCLLRELFGFVVRGILLSWFRSYLTDRWHRTVIDGRASFRLPISSAVPRGSMLGPLLFIIDINSAQV